MDSNKPTASTPPTAVGSGPAAPPVPNATQPAGATPTPVGGGSKKIFLIVGVVVLILLAVGVYMYMSGQKPAKAPAVQSTNNQPVPIQPKDTTQEDLNAIDVASPDSDFVSIDSDLQSL